MIDCVTKNIYNNIGVDFCRAPFKLTSGTYSSKSGNQYLKRWQKATIIYEKGGQSTLSYGEENFFSWLTDDKNYEKKDAKKIMHTIITLDGYARRRLQGLADLFYASTTKIESYIDEFHSNAFLKNADNRRKGELTNALFLLKEFFSSQNISTTKKIIAKTKPAPTQPVPVKIETEAVLKSNNKARTPETKLIRRIKREIKKCTYIGDILISDEEYKILKDFFRYGYRQICESPCHESVNPLFAVALVQVGIRFYDGMFWPHVQKELGVERLTSNHQAWIGRSFYKTLLQYGKHHVSPNEYVNNVLLHCFVTKYYADDLFDFLFAYYRIDLERDLTRNNPEMRKYLMQSMSKGETSARAYKIKKHTSDAVSANEKGCKIRVGRILRFMDNALFNDLYPTKSQNRIARLFCSWANTSEKFNCEKKYARGLTRKGTKHFSTPYIHFDGAKSRFYIVLPSQYIRLADEEILPQISCTVTVGENEQTIDVESESCVTGCKTSKIEDIEFSSDELFEEIKLELWKNSRERIQRFKIKADLVRFFDSDWDMIDPNAFVKCLPAGQVFAFTKPEGTINSDSDAVVGCEKTLGCCLYTLDLKRGDVLRLPDGKAKSVGKPLEEGVLQQNLVPGAYIMKGESRYSIYSDVPSVYFRMKVSRENGTVIIVNDKRCRFDIEKCVRFDMDEETDEKGYILKPDDYLVKDGIYKIVIDIPNSRKPLMYSFALIRKFSFQYDAAPYLFQHNGSIKFPENLRIRPLGNMTAPAEHQFDFVIRPDIDYLPFSIDIENETVELHIYFPAFKWKFDEGCWNTTAPEEIWHKEFPQTIYIKYPDDEITFSMTPIISGAADDEQEDDTFSASFSKDKANHLFCCDTRKMKSWLGREEAIRVLYVEFPSKKFAFADIVTRCQVNSVKILEDRQTGHLVFKSSISGFSDCVADIFYGEEPLVEKQKISTSGICLKVPFRSGKYRIIYYEWDEDEEDFGFADYRKFDDRTITYRNRFDLTGKEIFIQDVRKEKDSDSIFKPEHHEFKVPLKIFDVVCAKSEPDVYYGACCIAGQTLRLRLAPFDRIQGQASAKARITFFDEGDYLDFLYDRTTQELVAQEDDSLDGKQAQKRYIFLDSEEYYFSIYIK